MTEEMNLYQKINIIRKEFKDSDIKKSGENTFQKFKYFELYYTIWLESLRESHFKPTSGRVILINTSYDEQGYSYKSVNFDMSDLTDEEFDEFLKIFNIQGSCTSKISS